MNRQIRIAEAIDAMIANEHPVVDLIPMSIFLAYLTTATNDWLEANKDPTRLNEAQMREIWAETSVCGNRVKNRRSGDGKSSFPPIPGREANSSQDLEDDDGASVTGKNQAYLCE